MAIWEYKVITSGKGGFATPALLEKFLNDLGKDEWEIVHFQSQPDNALAFSGVMRRSTQRDWTLEDAAAAAARSEADKLRAEFEAKFRGAGAAPGGAAHEEEKAQSIAGEKIAAEDGFRRLRNTESDQDPDAPEEEKDAWDEFASEEALPTFFEAIRPHMRRNQRGPGMSVGIEYLAKKWELSDDDIKGALIECGFVIPEDEDANPIQLEYDGDLYWLNMNRRGEIWLNTREKPRPVFRTVAAQRVAEGAGGDAAPAESAPKSGRPPEERGRPSEEGGRRREAPAAPAAAGAAGAPAAVTPLPEGPALLEKIRPLMRRNRRGPGGSGSTSFLSRALKCNEAELMAAFLALGLAPAASPDDKPVPVTFGDEVWWLNQDQRGGTWINGREKSAEDAPGAAGVATTAESASQSGAAEAAPAAAAPNVPQFSAPAGATGNGEMLAAVRPLLKETKTGAFAGKADRVADELGQSAEGLVAALVGAGLKVPEKAREKPLFVEHGGEIFWFNRNAKDELWVNAKASKFADGEKKSAARRGRPTRKTDSGEAG